MTDMTETGDHDFTALTADIVSAYVANNPVPAAEVPGLIASTYAALTHLGSPAEPEPVKLEPPVPIRKTVTPDHIISLEDGKPYKALKRHLAGRGMTPDEYRRKWGLPVDYPMVAANYAAQRSELAKSSGLGQSRARAAAARASRDTAVSSKPARRGKTE
ncbi:MucR family transcriptional regulator [Methylobacterium nonmethylotrophicum]|uniref:MucR family transcriptional regulator n=1 Tax=Methylobacterium nonmethylotrophicum TaxID=1141884 RepID=A0A4Z0NQ13_9HYPH|nr:MucR family transcriptional regulator [Methylobacterium nonmethylotrophicum]TGD98089.1 MucR family transcriptional regulator [Methylobacterium nonmethylotrophicum]